MAEQRVQRRLAAILAADVVGYSRLMHADEIGTLASFNSHLREFLAPKIAERRGRIVKTLGDGLLAEFASIVDAVQCAEEIQRGMRGRNADLPSERQMRFRIGVNLGDVIVEGDDIHGDGVNVAARLETLAEPGGISISRSAFEEVRDKLRLRFVDLGAQQVKNTDRPVRAYRVVLDDESGAPSPPRPGAKPALPVPDKPSVAVLPFDNMSADPEQEYFADGVTEDIITDLSKISGLFVISRNSAFVYKGRRVGVREVGRELGVRYVLEGSVRRAGNRVRINAQLVDAVDELHLWAERYDGTLDDVFALQDEVAHKVVAAMEVKLTATERQAFAPRREVAFEAYDLLLRGRQYFFRFTPGANAEARRLLAKALELEPDYPAATASLAECHLQLWHQGWSDDPAQTLQQAATLARRAIELDESLADGHLTLAHVAVWQKRHDLALREADRAVELDPNNARANGVRSMVLTWSGQPAEALSPAEAAIRLDPVAAATFLWSRGHALYCLGRHEEALASLKESALLNPDFMPVHIWLAASHACLDELTEAEAAVAAVRRVNPAVSLAWTREVAPYRDPAMLTALIDDLRRAGLREA